MNEIHWKLTDLAAILRETDDFSYVSVTRVREDTVVDEYGNSVTILVRDDIGMYDMGAVTVGGPRVLGLDTPFVNMPFSLLILKDIGPRKLAEIITPSLLEGLQLRRATVRTSE